MRRLPRSTLSPYTMRFRAALLASPYWTSHISYETIASLLRTSAVLAVLMCLHSIIAEYNGPLEAAHAYIADDKYDMVVCGVACQPTLDLSDQLRGCSIAFTYVTRLSNANVPV